MRAVRFWDSSALVPLLVTEEGTEAATRPYRADPATVAWWAQPRESASALARREQAGHLGTAVTWP